MTSSRGVDKQTPSRRKRVVVAWTREGLGLRSRKLADAFGAQGIHSFRGRLFGVSLPAPVRYVFQSFDTFRKLVGIRPRTILVQVPPFPLTLIVWFYCKLFGADFIADYHSSGLVERKWRRFHRIDRFLARRALANIAHNQNNAEILEAWNAKNPLTVLSPASPREEIIDESVELPDDLERDLARNGLKVLMVNRFGTDDCHNEVLEAAGLMPEAIFFITGDYKLAGLERGGVPQNVSLTGFLDRSVFLRLMDRCDVVLALTSRKDTLLWSIRECLALQKSFVATDSHVMKSNFGEYGMFTDNTPDDIVEKIGQAYSARAELSREMASYVEQDNERWNADVERLEKLINSKVQSESS